MYLLGCSSNDLGMRRGTIPDSAITASSAQNSDSNAYYARLNNTKAWVPDPNSKSAWIQVNLQYMRNITGIATQGFQGSYVKQYYVSYGDDGTNWRNYTEQGTVKVSCSLQDYFY